MLLKAIILAVLGIVATGMAAGAIAIGTGAYNVGTDDPHTSWVTSLLTTTREKSIERRASDIKVPDLSSADLIKIGAGQYAAMCAGCHLAPGFEEDLRPGLNPRPPDLTKLGVKDSARTFWIIKHGIKMSGMPAWGVNHDDETLWSMVAFLNKLPGMTPEQYTGLVSDMKSDGNSHGAGSAGHHGGSTEKGRHHGKSSAHGNHKHKH